VYFWVCEIRGRPNSKVWSFTVIIVKKVLLGYREPRRLFLSTGCKGRCIWGVQERIAWRTSTFWLDSHLCVLLIGWEGLRMCTRVCDRELKVLFALGRFRRRSFLKCKDLDNMSGMDIEYNKTDSFEKVDGLEHKVLATGMG